MSLTDTPRVVMIIIDAMPHRYVSPELTPRLWEQVVMGGRAPLGALSLPCSVTYANHAAFVTGADPTQTGVYGNHTWDDDAGWVSAPKSGPMAPTVFDRVAEAGGRSVLVVGDQKLVSQMGGSACDYAWPPDGRIPKGTERCEFGYASDAAVVAAVQDADLAATLVVLHLNQPDTTSHLYGPDSDEAAAQYRATDAAYGELIDQLADGWPTTVVLTVSDHDQETITDFTPVLLAEALSMFDSIAVAEEGTGALIHGPVDETMRSVIRDVPGVEAAQPLDDDVWLAWTEPGRSFGAPPIPIHGQHGSPRCRTQIAIVSGGHEAVSEIARRIEGEQPSVLDWAPLICELLGLPTLPSC